LRARARSTHRFVAAQRAKCLQEALGRRTLALFQGGRREPAETVLTALALKRLPRTATLRT